MSNKPTYEELENRVKELELVAATLKKTKEELLESEQCFRTMIEKSPSAIELYEPNGKLLIVNEEWESFWNLKRSDVADFNILDDKECERTGLTAAFKKALRGIVCRIPPAKYDPKESGMSGGSIRWIDSKMYPIHYQNGKINKIVLVMEDITELKQSEEELRKHQVNLEDLIKERTVELEKEITERKQVEKKMKRSETFLNKTGQISKVGGWEVEAATMKVFWTKEIYNIMEVLSDYDPSSLGEESIVFFSADDQLWLNNAIQRSFEHGEPYYNKEFQITTAKGNKKWVCANCEPITAGGRVVTLSGTFQDITERKKIEFQLKESEGKFRAIVENSKGIVYIIDKDGYFVLSEGAALSGLGLKPGQMVGMDAFEVYKEYPEIIKGIKQALKGETVHDPQLVVQGVRDQRHYDIFYTPNYMDGEVIGIIGEAIDITERNQVQEELKKTKAILQAALDNSPVAIAIANAPDGKLIYVNNAGLSIRADTEEELVKDVGIGEYASSWRILHFDGTEYQTNEVPLARAIKYGEPCTDEFIIRRNDGEDRIVLANAAPIFDYKGNVSQGIVAFHDITERKQAEEQIKSNLKEKETLLQEIHHRVKNNLTVVASLLKLQANGMEDERLKAALSDSQSREQAMSAIHETLYQSENLSAIDMNIYLSKLGNDVARNYSIGSKVNLIIESESVLIGAKQASPVGLIVNELVTNSLKYAFSNNEDGEIKINLQRREDQVELECIDNGIGMPDRFDWKNSSSLGLKLVRTLVENQLDGSINKESNNGTKFTIKFNIET
ncbi:MAG: PAS domain S-box protein [Deltaproteobacteria bacterium]|nr:PAS domain S-box protein [Deltaproteobacteria bacterium]